MLNLFKKGIALQLVVILAAVLALWAKAFVHPVVMPVPTAYGPIYEMLYDWFSGIPLIATGIALLLVIGEGLLFNEMLSSKGMASQNTLLPMFIFTLLMSIGSENHTITPALLINLLLLFSMQQLLQSGQPIVTVSKIANTSFMVAVASLCYFPSVVLLIPLLIMMPVFKMYRWNDWMALLLGLLGPYLIWMLICFLNDTLVVQFDQIWRTISNLNLDLTGTTSEYVVSVLLALLAIIFLVGGLSQSSRGTTVYKNNVRVIVLPMISSLIVLAYAGFVPLKMEWFALGTSFAATVFFWDAKKRLWAYDLILAALAAITLTTVLL